MSVTTNTEWDEPLSAFLHDEWSSWVDSLSHLESFCLPRSYSSSFVNATRREELVSMLSTMKTKHDVKPFPTFGSKDALKSTWKCVQVMADEFWHRWKTEYLHNLSQEVAEPCCKFETRRLSSID